MKMEMPLTETYEAVLKIQAQLKRGLINEGDFKAQLLRILVDFKSDCITAGVDFTQNFYNVGAGKR